MRARLRRLIDAFVVRMTIVPAVMAMLGAKSWYLPRRLDRLLPDVDIEGAGLRPDATAEPVGTPEPVEA